MIEEPTELMEALRDKADLEEIKRLIEAGEDVNAITIDGDTVLSFACLNSPEVLWLLLEAGADPNIEGREGMSVLMHTAQYNENIDACQLLIEYGANIHAKDIDGNTAVWWSKYNPNREVRYFLQKKMAVTTFKVKPT